MFLEVEEGGRDRYKEAEKVYLIRFIADVSLGWYMGCVTEIIAKFLNSCFSAFG